MLNNIPNPYEQMPPMFRRRPTYLRIDLDAITHNLDVLRSIANHHMPPTFMSGTQERTHDPHGDQWAGRTEQGGPTYRASVAGRKSGVSDVDVPETTSENPRNPTSRQRSEKSGHTAPSVNPRGQARTGEQQSTHVMAILKANAYGHGLLPVALKLAHEGVDLFGVAFLEEAVLMRQAGIEAPILVLGGLVGYQVKHFLDYHLDITASSLYKAQQISEEAQRVGRTARVHLKIDTGMNRIGVRADNALRFALDAARLPNIELVGIFSHFVRAQGPDRELADRQLEAFNEVLDGCRRNGIEFEMVHMANSAALLNLPDAHFNVVRPGLTLYGCPPGAHIPNEWNLKPALSLHSEIVFFKGIRKGAGVGYMHTWTAPEDGWLATLPMGYGDGYPRHLSNKGEVLIRGKRYPVVGNISMDQMMIFTGQDQLSVGEDVTLLGSQDDDTITAWELATRAGTIAYEILCGWTPRVPRVYEGKGWKPAMT